MNDTKFYVYSLFESKKNPGSFYAGMIYRSVGSSQSSLDNKGFTKVVSGSVFYAIKEVLEKGNILCEVEAVPVVTQYGPQLQITGVVKTDKK